MTKGVVGEGREAEEVRGRRGGMGKGGEKE